MSHCSDINCFLWLGWELRMAPLPLKEFEDYITYLYIVPVGIVMCIAFSLRSLVLARNWKNVNKNPKYDDWIGKNISEPERIINSCLPYVMKTGKFGKIIQENHSLS